MTVGLNFLTYVHMRREERLQCANEAMATAFFIVSMAAVWCCFFLPF